MHNNRQHERESVALSGRIRNADSDSEPVDCEILDLSPGGAKIKTGTGFDKGTAVFLQIGQMGEFGADVVWHRRPLAGLTFHAPPEVMTDVVMAVAVYR